MTAHKHAGLIAEYAKDAAETDKPWERWECLPANGLPFTLQKHPDWDVNLIYRRKRVPLCQVEGKDVFAGDRLWHDGKPFVVTSMGSGAGWNTWLKDVGGVLHAPDAVSWSEPPKTKTVYQWAMQADTNTWYVSSMFFASEDEVRNAYNAFLAFRRLDWTALEVPCDD